MKKIVFLSLAFLLVMITLKALPNREQSISLDGWLGLFQTSIGTPSESQFLTVTGTELTEDIAVSAVIGFEFSTDDLSWSDSLSLPSSYDGPVYIHLVGEELGTKEGIISFTSIGANPAEKYISGIVYDLVPEITVEGWLGQFSTMIGTPSESQSVWLSGTNMTADFAVSAVAGFEYSTDETNWSDSLSLVYTYAGLIYMRLKGDSIGSFEGMMSFSSPGAVTVQKYISGIVLPLIPIITVEGWLNQFSTMLGFPSESQSVQVSGTNMEDDIGVSNAIGFEFSINDITWSDSLTLPQSFNGLVYIRLTGDEIGSVVDTVSFTSTGAATVQKYLSGTVYPIIREISVEGSFSLFSTIVGTVSEAQWVVVSGTNLTTDIKVSTVIGYEYSIDLANWSDSLSLPPTYDGRVYVRLTGNAVGSPNGTILFTSTGSSPASLPVSGIVNPIPPEIIVTGKFSLFSGMVDSPSASQSVAVSGTNLTAGITVSAVAGYEYSTTNNDPWSASLSLDSTFTGNVYVRLNSTVQGSYQGMIVFHAPGAVQVTRNVIGWVNSSVGITPEPVPGLIWGDINSYYATNATGPLDVPSYMPFEGINEVVHPDVIYFPNGWNSYQYWMIYTPFPNNDATYENPCLAVSNDNVNWIVPPGLTNPVDSYASSANDYYSDTELIMDANQTTMYMLFRRSINNYVEKLYVKSSTDGITWSPTTEILSSFENEESLISPAIVLNNNQYMMWTIDLGMSPRVIRLRTANSIYGPWSASVVTNVRPLTYDNLGNPLTESWHINVTKIGNQYWMINNNTAIGGTNGVDLYLGISDDGLQWTFASHPVLSARYSYQYWDQRLYRASIIPINDGQQMGLRIWYSVMRKATSQNPPWRIGYTEAWCAPRNTRIQSVNGENVTMVWDVFASVYLKNTTYKVQQTATPFLESSWQDATAWNSSLSYTFLRNAYAKQFFRVKARVE